jgi:hypothetical protein
VLSWPPDFVIKFSDVIKDFSSAVFPPAYDPLQYTTKKSTSKKRKAGDGVLGDLSFRIWFMLSSFDGGEHSWHY